MKTVIEIAKPVEMNKQSTLYPGSHQMNIISGACALVLQPALQRVINKDQTDGPAQTNFPNQLKCSQRKFLQVTSKKIAGSTWRPASKELIGKGGGGGDR